MTKYVLFADEAWTHGSLPLRRYWCFFGGVLGTESAIAKLNHRIGLVRTAHKISGEIKWSNLSGSNAAAYHALVDTFIDALEPLDLRYRQFFTSREFVRPGPALAPIDVQFRLYYQFLKHSFGLRHMPQSAGRTEILVRLDNHSSQSRKDKLVEFVERLPGQWGRTDIDISVHFVQSSSALPLQVCDVLMGAAGSYGNMMHKERQPGQRGMRSKQKLRYDLAKHIYNKVRALDAAERGSRAFNWFESTGGSGRDRWQHRFRIWKFKPGYFRIDRGWQNDHLGVGGVYNGSDVDPQIRTPDGGVVETVPDDWFDL